MYTDVNNVTYGIGCQIVFAGNDIGTPVSEVSFVACLLYCDTMSGCAGAQYDTSQNLCYLKSSFAGAQTPNAAFIYGRKGQAVSVPASQSATSTTTLCEYPTSSPPNSLTCRSSIKRRHNHYPVNHHCDIHRAERRLLHKWGQWIVPRVYHNLRNYHTIRLDYGTEWFSLSMLAKLWSYSNSPYWHAMSW